MGPLTTRRLNGSELEPTIRLVTTIMTIVTACEGRLDNLQPLWLEGSTSSTTSLGVPSTGFRRNRDVGADSRNTGWLAH